MANIFFSGDKLEKQDAINSLTLKISEYFGGRYEVRGVARMSIYYMSNLGDSCEHES